MINTTDLKLKATKLYGEAGKYCSEKLLADHDYGERHLNVIQDMIVSAEAERDKVEKEIAGLEPSDPKYTVKIGKYKDSVEALEKKLVALKLAKIKCNRLVDSIKSDIDKIVENNYNIDNFKKELEIVVKEADHVQMQENNKCQLTVGFGNYIDKISYLNKKITPLEADNEKLEKSVEDKLIQVKKITYDKDR